MLANAVSSSHHKGAGFAFSPLETEILDLIDHRSPAKRCAVLRKPTPVRALPEVVGERTVLAVDLLHGRWTVQVLSALRGGPVRLGQLHRLLPESSKKVLTQTLRKLEECRLLDRRDLSGKVRHVEYHLSPAMRPAVCNLLDQLQRWGEACEQLR